MSKRKLFNDAAGYVCQLKSKHPKLPGYFVIFDRNKGGDWVTGSDGERYGVIHGRPDGTLGCVVTVPNMSSARALMKAMAAGSNVCDLGQYEQA